MRVRLFLDVPDRPLKAWFELSELRHPLISDAVDSIAAEFGLRRGKNASDLLLEIDGFQLLGRQNTAGVVRDGDLIRVSYAEGRKRERSSRESDSSEEDNSEGEQMEINVNRVNQGKESAKLKKKVRHVSKRRKTVSKQENEKQSCVPAKVTALTSFSSSSSSESGSDSASGSESESESESESTSEAESRDGGSCSEESEKASSSLEEGSNSSDDSDASSSEDSFQEPDSESESENTSGNIDQEIISKESSEKPLVSAVIPLSRPVAAPSVPKQTPVVHNKAQPAAAQIITPPLSLGKHKKKQTLELLRKQTMHIRFDDVDEDGHRDQVQNGGESSYNVDIIDSTTANGYEVIANRGQVAVTRVYLDDGWKRKCNRDDDGSTNGAETNGGTRNSRNSKRRRSRKKRNGHDGTSADQTKSREDGKLVEDETAQNLQESTCNAPKNSDSDNKTRTSRDLSKLDYSSYPNLPFPIPSTRVAFKVLELSPTYEPIISEWKVGKIVSIDENAHVTIELESWCVPSPSVQYEAELAEYGAKRRGPGKFELVHHVSEGEEIEMDLEDDARLIWQGDWTEMMNAKKLEL